MSTTFGEFIDATNAQEFLLIGFSPSTLPIQTRWRNNGLSADFLADYWGTFFPSSDTESSVRRAEIKNAIAYIANELLENTMKFNYDAEQVPISIKLSLFTDELRFYVTNSINPDTVDKFQQYIQRLLSEDPEDLYIRQLEMNAREDNHAVSRLGLLTMLNDYGVRLSWKFSVLEEKNPRIMTVTTMVRLPL